MSNRNEQFDWLQGALVGLVLGWVSAFFYFASKL